PRRALALALVSAGFDGPLTVKFFRRVRDVEFYAGVRAAGGVPARRKVRVLCYHSIADLNGGGKLDQYSVAPATFRRQLPLLARYFRLVDAAEFRRFLKGGGVPRRAVLLTFDDCFADLADAGLPALRELEIPAVGFAVTGLL